MELTANTVHIWLTRKSLIPASAVAEYYNLMSQAEQLRNVRFSSRMLRDSDAITRALLRTTLSRYEECPPSQWQFNEGERGKPHIAGPGPRLFFSLSHTSEWVACAVARFPVIGIDVERCDRDLAVLRLAKRYFSPLEYRDLLTLSGAAQKDRFFDLWTLKEAYIKARGEGIALGLDKFGFSFLENGRIAIECDALLQENPSAWHFRLSPARGDHRLALAVKPPAIIEAIAIRHYVTVPQRSTETYTGPLQLFE